MGPGTKGHGFSGIFSGLAVLSLLAFVHCGNPATPTSGRVAREGTPQTNEPSPAGQDVYEPVEVDASPAETPPGTGIPDTAEQAVAGNEIFIADSVNRRVRKVTEQTSRITTVAGSGVGDGNPATSAALLRPLGVARDASGNLYVADADGHRVRKIAANGTISTVAGNGLSGFSGDGGLGTSARLYSPSGVAIDGAGNLYIADADNNRVRKLSPAGILTTVAGNGYGFAGDGGPATAALMKYPTGIALDGGTLYIADRVNNRIRRVALDGTITTVAGNGVSGYAGDGGPAISSSLNEPTGVALDKAGNLYIADRFNNRVRRVATDGTISTVAGNGNTGFGGDGGQAVQARLFYPFGLTIDSQGALYIADATNDRVRRVAVDGTISTVAGSGSSGFSGDAAAATTASLDSPSGVIVGTGGELIIADASNSRVRGVGTDGVIRTIGGNGTTGYGGDGGQATTALLRPPSGIAVDGAGNLYVSDTDNHRVRKIAADGTIATVAGNGVNGYGGDGGSATTARLSYPGGVAVDATGNLYVADRANNRIRKVTPAGAISTVAGNGSSGSGGDDGPATSARLGSPVDVAVDGRGNLYIADRSNHRIRRVSAAGIITTIAGTGGYGFSGDGGAATAANLASPMGVDVDGSGSVFIADLGNHRIRRVSVGGTISTVAGTGLSGFSGDGGAATAAGIAAPYDVAVDAEGVLYIADRDNHRIRRVGVDGRISTLAGNGVAAFQGDAGSSESASLNSPSAVAVRTIP